MTLPRVLVLFAVLAGVALSLAIWGAPSAGAADAAVAAAEAPAQTVGHREVGLVNPTSVFFGCAVGTAVGALVTALPPVVGWAFYAGALPAVAALIATSGVGCTVGLFAGVILSTFHWMMATISQAWTAVFG